MYKASLFWRFLRQPSTNVCFYKFKTTPLTTTLFREFICLPRNFNPEIFKGKKLCNNFVRHNSDTEDVICYAELRRLRRSGDVVIIDVRTKEETWRTGTIPGSVCIPIQELGTALNLDPEEFSKAYCTEKPKKDDKIVFICRRGERSYRASLEARKMGFKNSKSLQGGLLGWLDRERKKRESKYKTVKQDKHKG